MTLPQQVLQRLSDVDGLRVFPGAELRHHTRFRLGGPCPVLVDSASASSFQDAYEILAASGMRWTTIGAGTNLVVSDNGYPGAILRYSAAGIAPVAGTLIVEAGVELNRLIDVANGHGLSGIESMAGIPGWVGAAIYGNAGAYGQSMHQRVETVQFFDGRITREWSNEECGFRYRHSRFKENKSFQILSAKLSFHPGERAALESKSKEIRAVRDAKFPPTMACAGSVFKNFLWKDLPQKARAAVPANKVIEGKVPAGWFLEEVGAKGLQFGDIKVASYHANLLYNTANGTTADLLKLIAELKSRVLAKFDLAIEEEVQYVGFDAN